MAKAVLKPSQARTPPSQSPSHKMGPLVTDRIHEVIRHLEVPVEKIVEKLVHQEVIKEVEKPVYIDRPVVKEVLKEVPKEVLVEKLVEKVVPVETIKHIEVPVDKMIERRLIPVWMKYLLACETILLAYLLYHHPHF